jgi:hypothetical protein
MAGASLTRFEFTSFKDKAPPSDLAQVPAQATISFYRQGATLTQSFSFPQIPEEPQAIHVDHPGDIGESDILATFDMDSSTPDLSSTRLFVDHIEFDEAQGWLIWVTPDGAPFSGVAGERLVVTSNQPLCYQDARGCSGGATYLVSAAATGRAGGYLSHPRYDFLVIVANRPKRLYIAAIGGPPPSAIAATDHQLDLQTLVDACPEGGTVFLPSGDYRVPSGGLVLSRPMILRGETGTKLISHADDVNQPVLKIVPGGRDLTGLELHNLHLTNTTRPSVIKTGNYGVQCDVPADGSKIGHIILERIRVSLMGDDGLHFHALGDSDSYIVFATMRNVFVDWCKGNGAYFKIANMLSAYDCYFVANDLCGVVLDQVESQFLGCGFEDNCKSDDAERMDEKAAGQVYVLNCPISRFESCHWENFATTNQPINRRALTIDGSPCCIVGGCRFVNTSSELANTAGNHWPRAIYCRSGVSGSGVMACTILPNRYMNTAVAVEVEASTGIAQDCIVHPQYVESGTGEVLLPVGVANNGLVALGGKRTAGGVAKGVAIPCVANSSTRPVLGSGTNLGYVLYDLQAQRLVYWDGGIWREVSTT